MCSIHNHMCKNDFDYNFVTLNGTSQYLLIPDTDDFSHSIGSGEMRRLDNLPFTVSAWINVSSLSAVRVIFTKGFTGASSSDLNKREYYSYVHTNGSIFFSIRMPVPISRI